MSKLDIKDWLDNKKGRRKVFRTIFQILILAAIISVVIRVVFNVNTYKPEDESKKIYDNGFIAISYFGVDRTQKYALIDDDMLKEHLKALKGSGYATIDQQDILDYCNFGKKLPEKAMFLSFEDGRVDSALFSHPILEDLNYRASMFTYAGKFAEGDFKFLQPENLRGLEKSTYWELGTNGYRFHYINVFDRYGHFLDVLNQDEFNIAAKYIDDDYNHYLMDFIKDKDRVTIETKDEMDKRITWDYNQMNDIYSNKFGYVPKAYMIMHANGLNNGETNPLVESVNNREIRKLFELHFNREGESFNNKGSDLFNLTRLQAQPYWYSNHLLMRVGDDTKNEMNFVVGDENRAAKWTVSSGAAEFKKSKIILTSKPEAEGNMKLKGSEDYSDYKLSTSIEGNVIGTQSIYLRYNEEENTYVNVNVKDNILYVNEKIANNDEKNLMKCDLRELLKKDVQSVDQVMSESKSAKNEIESVKARKNKDETFVIENKNVELGTLDNGGEEYVPKIGVGQIGNRKLEIVISGDKLNVSVDGVGATGVLTLNGDNTKGSVCLKSMRSEKNIRDNVYDGVFNDLYIEPIAKNSEKVEPLFDNRLNGFQNLLDEVKDKFNKVIDWFIENF